MKFREDIQPPELRRKDLEIEPLETTKRVQLDQKTVRVLVPPGDPSFGTANWASLGQKLQFPLGECTNAATWRRILVPKSGSPGGTKTRTAFCSN